MLKTLTKQTHQGRYIPSAEQTIYYDKRKNADHNSVDVNCGSGL